VDSTRKTSLLFGVLFIITFITSIPALLLYGPVLNQADYIVGAGADTRVEWGAFLEVLLIISNIGTALVVFPILKRQNEWLALGYVTARIMESAFIAVGILSVLSVVTLRQGFARTGGADAASFVTAGKSLIEIKDWTFLLGPGFVVGVGNGLILGYLMYRSGLMPRGLTMLGLIGGPLLCISGIAVIFGIIDRQSTPQFIMTIPEILWELSLCIYPTFKGFKSSPIAWHSEAAEAVPSAV
jgi:Domain of unknown function (DUF4386)